MKRRNAIAFIYILVIIVCMSLLLVACDRANDQNTAEEEIYSIKYFDDEGLHTIDVRRGDIYTLEHIPQKIGHTFKGLFDAENGGTQYVAANGLSIGDFRDRSNIVLYPQFEPKQYTVVLDYEGAETSGIDQIQMTYGDRFTDLPLNLEVQYKTFVGWYTAPNRGGKQIAGTTGIIPQNSILDERTFDLNEDSLYLTLYAGFKTEEYTVIFYFGDNDVPLEMQIERGKKLSDLPLDSRINGKAVLSWSRSCGEYAAEDVFDGPIEGPMVLYSYELAPVIDFNSNGGASVVSLIEKEGTPISLPTPFRSGYKFLGWYTASNAEFTSGVMPSNSITLYAKWQEILENSVIFNQYIRTSEYKINGSGHYTQDAIELPNSIEWYKARGYTHLKFVIVFDLKENDNCYQYCYLLDGAGTVFANETIQHGGDKKDNNYGSHAMSVELSLDALNTNILFFKCQAENAIFKDFFIRNIKVTVTATQKLNNI